MSGVRYSVSEVIRKVLEDTDDDFSAISSDSDDSVSDQDHVSEAEAVESSSSDESDFEPVVPVTRGRGRGRCRGRGRGVASRGRGSSTCSRGRPVHNVVDSTGETAADFQKSDEMKTKSGKMWSKTAPVVHRRGPQDIIRTPSGIRHEACAENELDIFKLIITPEILDIITRETNREAQRKIAEWNGANPQNMQEWKPTTVAEIQAVIGLVILAGLHRGRLEPLEELWSASKGRPIFSAVCL